jgi:L-alanine-DL-glutamate epimerase-like enolase superfamily enzyme
LLVKVATDEGLEGWGEAFGFNAATSGRLAIDELIAPLCIGRDERELHHPAPNTVPNLPNQRDVLAFLVSRF